VRAVAAAGELDRGEEIIHAISEPDERDEGKASSWIPPHLHTHSSRHGGTFRPKRLEALPTLDATGWQTLGLPQKQPFSGLRLTSRPHHSVPKVLSVHNRPQPTLADEGGTQPGAKLPFLARP
jgi:hypothetical protein